MHNLTKDQLIDIIMRLNPVPRYQPKTLNKKTKFAPLLKNVKVMVQAYERNIIEPPVPLPRTKKPIPLPRTRIDETNKAIKGTGLNWFLVLNFFEPFFG